MATGQLPDVRNYLRNRALRILPAYWVILTIVAVIVPAALLRLSSSELVLDRLVDRPDILVNNALLLHNYVPASLDTGIGPAWSLAIEIVFYLSLPGLAVLARYYFRRADSTQGRWLALLAPPAALLLLGAAGKAATVWLFPPDDFPVHAILARSFLSHADLFAPGMALAVVHVLVVSDQMRLPRRWAVIVGTILVVDVATIVALTDRGMLPDWGLANPYQRLTALACVLLVALVALPRPATGRPSVLVTVLESRPLFLAGLASYSLFLWHEPITRLLAEQGLTVGGRAGFAHQHRRGRRGQWGSCCGDVPLRGATGVGPQGRRNNGSATSKANDGGPQSPWTWLRHTSARRAYPASLRRAVAERTRSCLCWPRRLRGGSRRHGIGHGSTTNLPRLGKTRHH